MYRLVLLIVWAVLALPGVVLNAPIFTLASIISRKKAKGELVLIIACIVSSNVSV